MVPGIPPPSRAMCWSSHRTNCVRVSVSVSIHWQLPAWGVRACVRPPEHEVEELVVCALAQLRPDVEDVLTPHQPSAIRVQAIKDVLA